MLSLKDYQISTIVPSSITYLQKEKGLSLDTIYPFLSNMLNVRGQVADIYNIGFPFLSLDKKIEGFYLLNYNFKKVALFGNDDTVYIWENCFASFPQFVKNVFIANDPIELLSFYQVHSNKINFETSAFISTNGVIIGPIIDRIKKTYPNAKFNTCFSNDLYGKISDIKVSLHLKKKEFNIYLKDDKIHFENIESKHTFCLLKHNLSLRKFQDYSKIKSLVNTWAMPKNVTHYNQLIA